MQRILALAVVVTSAACGPKPAAREASLAFSSNEEDECSQTLAVAHSAGVVRLEWTSRGEARLIVQEASHDVAVTKSSNRVETVVSCTEAVFVGNAHPAPHGTRLVFDRVRTDWHWSGAARTARSGPARAAKLQVSCRAARAGTECSAVGVPDAVPLPTSTPWRFGRHLEVQRTAWIVDTRYDDRPLDAAELASIRRCFP
ncbi:MAG TPA: hypothetical protein VGF94_26295 [Kofleriaceae bacterium]